MFAPLAVVLAAVAGSCTEIGTSPTTITSLEFDSLPFPAVVTGDTLRDSLGRAAPLHAIAFNAAGRIVPNPSITYLALDSGLTIGPTGIVTAQLRNGAVRVIASAPGLQSVPETLVVARRPDSVIATQRVDTLLYSTPDSVGVNVVPALPLQVATRDTVGGITGTQGWLVSYQVFFHGKALAITDTTIASLWNTAGLPALLDTTQLGGTVSPRLRVRSTLLPTLTESLTVVATVRYRGAPVPGSPVTYLIQLRSKSQP
jgi:uncharacterized membrane protein